MTTKGPALFSRFAFPPNHLGYCGPADIHLLPQLMEGDGSPSELRQVIRAFDGAWPYLELISACTGLDQLDARVVEAYWLGSALLDRVDLSMMGNSMEDRFRLRSGWDWETLANGLNLGARPTHSFHVFCIYPWVGLLRSGVVDQALHVLDSCRIRWGRVIGFSGDQVLVQSRRLVWDGRRLSLAPEQAEAVLHPIGGPGLVSGDTVAMHWDYVCQRISRRQRDNLEKYHNLHLAIANRAGTALASRVEG